MDLLKSLIVIVLSSVLVNNYVLSRFLGICPFLGVSKKLDQATGMGISVTAVMLLATAVTWPIQKLILDPLGLGYMQTILFILVIAALVQMLELLLKRFIPALHKSLGVYLPLITTNCAVLGVALTNVQNKYNFWQSIVCGFGTALGYLIAIVILAGIRERNANNDVPTPFKGSPIVMITAALMAMAFFGFANLAI